METNEKKLNAKAGRSVSYDFSLQSSPNCKKDKSTKTENEVLNVVELNDKQSDEFLKVCLFLGLFYFYTKQQYFDLGKEMGRTLIKRPIFW